MKTREQVDAAIKEWSGTVFATRSHENAFTTMVEYIQQEPESDGEVKKEIHLLLNEWEEQTGKGGWAYTAMDDQYRLMQWDASSSAYRITHAVGMTLTELRDQLIKLTKPPVPTLEDIEKFVSLGGDSSCWTRDEVDKIRRYIAGQRTLAN